MCKANLIRVSIPKGVQHDPGEECFIPVESVGKAPCGCTHHAKNGSPCEHDVRQAIECNVAIFVADSSAVALIPTVDLRKVG